MELKINKAKGENFGYQFYKYTCVRHFHFDKDSKNVDFENFEDLKWLKN